MTAFSPGGRASAQGLEAIRARRRQGEDKRDTLQCGRLAVFDDISRDGAIAGGDNFASRSGPASSAGTAGRSDPGAK
jgi:hypothetical protein